MTTPSFNISPRRKGVALLSPLIVMAIVCSMLFPTELISQVPRESVVHDLMRINSAMEKPGGLNMTLKYRLFDSWNSKVSIESYEGHVKRVGRYHIYQQVGDVAIITNKNHIVRIDKEDNRILIAKIDTADLDIYAPVSEVMKGVLDHCSSIEKIGSTQSLRGYRFRFDSYIYSHIELFYHSTDWLPAKLVLYMDMESVDPESGVEEAQASRMELEFVYHGNISMDSKLFDTSTYVTHMSGKWSGLGLYKDFEVISLIVE